MPPEVVCNNGDVVKVHYVQEGKSRWSIGYIMGSTRSRGEDMLTLKQGSEGETRHIRIKSVEAIRKVADADS